MNKLWLIIKREYWTRVRKRSFIIGTVVTPIAILLFIGVISYIFSYQGNDKQRIVIRDEAGLLQKAMKDGNGVYFSFSEAPLADLKKEVAEGVFSGALLIPPLGDLKKKEHQILLYSDEQLSPETSSFIRGRVAKAIRAFKMDSLHLTSNQLAMLNSETEVSLNPESIKKTENDATEFTSDIAMAVGYAMGFIMYMTVFIYGMMVMRSVMEEKTNRIVEVMMSSVKPFELMMGKIIGSGAVGLTQVLIWVIIITAGMFVLPFFMNIDPEAMQRAQEAQMGGMANTAMSDPEAMQFRIAGALQEVMNLNWWFLIPAFIFYFLGGYFLYASLFAAVGSAMGDDYGEGQSLTIPITIPVLLALYIMMVVVRQPNSALGVWASIFPLFSPIVMPARLAFGPPLWQIALSMLVLAATSVFFVWLAGRIYRVGILLYGKKVTLKELGKWLFYKG